MTNPTDLLARGRAYFDIGRTREAVEAWEAVLRAEPTNQEAKALLTRALSPRPAVAEAHPEWFNGWDDGPKAAPSRVVHIEEPPMELVEPTAPILVSRRPSAPAPAREAEVDEPTRRVRELYALNDFSGALEACDAILAGDPTRADLVQLRSECAVTLTSMYESRLGPLAGVPKVSAQPDEIIWLNLDHRAGFVLAQIDGQVSYEDLYAICGMSRLDTAKILAQLLGEKVIATVR